MKAAIRVFVKIDLVVAQLAQKGQIAGPVLIRILVSREPSSDVMLCEFSLTTIRETKQVPCVWREAIGLLKLIRLFGFLPFILISVVSLVLYRGASALAICLNTVAALFLVELDNLAFSHGLNEATRMEAEEFGRVSVTDEDSRLIDVIMRELSSRRTVGA